MSRKLTAHISFTNPLPVSLQGGVFTVEGAGLTEAREIKTQYVICFIKNLEIIEASTLCLTRVYVFDSLAVAKLTPVRK